MAAFAYPIAADDGGQAAPGSLRGALFIAAGFAAAGVGEKQGLARRGIQSTSLLALLKQ